MVVVREPKSGLGRARNAGIAKASGEILAFTDDDCYVSPDFLKQIVKVFQDERIGYMGGRVLLYDKTDTPQTIRTETQIRIIEPHSYVRPGELQGANMAARSSLISEIGATIEIPATILGGAGDDGLHRLLRVLLAVNQRAVEIEEHRAHPGHASG